MNVQSAKNALEFTTIVRRDPGAVIVKVPGHGGRVYFVRVTERTVTCKRSRLQGGGNCPSVGCSASAPCYHGLAAWEKVHGPTSWCENEVDAERLENLGRHTVEVRSTQNGAKAWAVLKGKGISEIKRQGKILSLAHEYVALYDEQQENRLSDKEYQRLVECRRQFGILKIGHSEIKGLVAQAGQAELEKGRAVLRGDEDWEETI